MESRLYGDLSLMSSRIAQAGIGKPEIELVICTTAAINRPQRGFISAKKDFLNMHEQFWSCPLYQPAISYELLTWTSFNSNNFLNWHYMALRPNS